MPLYNEFRALADRAAFRLFIRFFATMQKRYELCKFGVAGIEAQGVQKFERLMVLRLESRHTLTGLRIRENNGCN